MLRRQRLLTRLTGYRNGRTVYSSACAPPRPGRDLARLVGHANSRPVYALADCAGPDGPGRRLTRLVGYAAGRPVYALTCCAGEAGSGSASGSGSGSGGVAGSGSVPAGASGSAPSGSAASASPASGAAGSPGFPHGSGSAPGQGSQVGASGSGPGASGSGSGSATGGGGLVQTSCCAGGISRDLFVVLSGGLSGTYPVTSTGSASWQGTGVLCSGFTSTLALTCANGTWILDIRPQVGNSGCTASCTLTSASCPPAFQLVFNCTSVSGCCLFITPTFTATVVS